VSWADTMTAIASIGGVAGIVSLLRFIALRKAESRQLEANAGLVESQTRTSESTS
jgi:hypothetical protein